MQSPGVTGRAVEQWRRRAVVELQGSGSAPSSRPQSLLSLSTVSEAQAAGAGPSTWDSVRTVSLPEEEHLHDQAMRQVSGGCSQWWWATQGWILAIGVGVCTSLTGIVIESGVNHLSSVRFGYCSTHALAHLRACPRGEWVFWGDGAVAFLNFVGVGTLMAVASALLVHFFAPAASGSGIPEVKTILNGFVMPDVVSFRTLCVKVVGLMLSVAAGMALGKEGPLVHVAVCWAQQFSGLFPQFQNEGKRRELFSAAAAAGVSTAFGAPLGGVLFSLEEVSTHFPSRTLLRAFTAAVTAAIVLTIVHPTNTEGLTLFSVTYRTTCHPLELLGFALLGVVGGLVGAAFNIVNVRWAAIRAHPKFRKRVPGVVEVGLIALVTLVSSWPLVLLQPLSSDAIHAMFNDCHPSRGNSDFRQHLGLCAADSQYAEPSAHLMAALAVAAAVRLVQLTLTFGTKCPAGLFVPSLFIGACLGRCMGVAMQAANSGQRLFAQDVEPGVYSMVGAAAVLGGVCRVTISLVAIMLELTGGMTYIVPFMLAVLIAKMVGDLFCEGIYDLYIVLKGYPYLQEELSITFQERCCDIMEPILTKLDVSRRISTQALQHLLDMHDYRGFPVVNGGHFVGYIHRTALEDLLAQLSAVPGASESGVGLEDVVPFTNTHVMRMVPDAPLSQVHKVFKQLGCKDIFIVGSKGSGPQDILQGMLTKKNFLLYLKSGKVGHMANHPSTVPPGGPLDFEPHRRPGILGNLLPPTRSWATSPAARRSWRAQSSRSGFESPDDGESLSGAHPPSRLPGTLDPMSFRAMH